MTEIITRKLNLTIFLYSVCVLFHRHQFITKEPDINFMDEEPVEGVSLVTDSQLVREMQVLLGNYVGARIFEHRFLPALYAVPLSMENIHQLQCIDLLDIKFSFSLRNLQF